MDEYLKEYQTWYYYNIWEILSCDTYSSENTFEKFYSRLNKPERFLPNYLSNKAVYDKLLQPLMNRWCNIRCIHVIAIDDLDVEALQGYDGPYLITADGKILCSNKSILAANSAVRTNVLTPILTKLGLVMNNKVREYELLSNISTKASFANTTTSKGTAVNRVNDTPNAIGNYSSDTYTSNISQASNTNTVTSSTNEYETYDIINSRLRTLQQEIIDEMRGFETWI